MCITTSTSVPWKLFCCSATVSTVSIVTTGLNRFFTSPLDRRDTTSFRDIGVKHVGGMRVPPHIPMKPIISHNYTMHRCFPGDHRCAQMRNGPKRTESMIPHGEDTQSESPSIATNLTNLPPFLTFLVDPHNENKLVARAANLSDLLKICRIYELFNAKPGSFSLRYVLFTNWLESGQPMTSDLYVLPTPVLMFAMTS